MAVVQSTYANDIPVGYGARGQAPDRWVALAAQRWPQVVEQECAKAKASVDSRAGG